MKIGDLVRLRHRGNGQPKIGLLVEHIDAELGYKVKWNDPKWSVTMWSECELEVIGEGR